MWKNPAIVEDKLCKEMEWFSVLAKGSDDFLPLDDKSKQRCKVKIKNIQVYDPCKIKKEELSGDIRKFPLVQWHRVFYLITVYFHWVHWLRKNWKHTKDF